MPAIDVDNLLKPIAGDNPCGAEDLRNDGRFLAVERLSEGTPDQEIGSPGDPNHQFIPGREPNWREVRDGCVEVLARGKHLRMAVVLAAAALRMEGYTGFRDGTRLIRGMLEQYWDTVWPVLDVEDNNDPTMRLNALDALAQPMGSSGDSLKLCDRLHEATLFKGSTTGPVSLRDIAIAAGTFPWTEREDGRPKPTADSAKIGFSESDPEFIETIAKAAEESLANVEAIDKIFTEKLGAGKGKDFSPIKTILKDAIANIRQRQAGNEDVAAAEEAGGAEGGGGGGGGGGKKALSGDIGSSADVERVFEKVIKYYEKHEASSPVPLLVKCAKLLIGKDFLAIYTILPPDAVALLTRIRDTEPPPESPS